MVKSRICTLVLTLAALLAAGPALAGEGEQRVLYGRALKERELGWACYARHYDAAHLRTHPDQNVRDIAMLAYRPDWQGADASILNFEAGFRDGGEPAQFSGECRSVDGGVLFCGIECDGGEFSLKAAAGARSSSICRPSPVSATRRMEQLVRVSVLMISVSVSIGSTSAIAAS